jgi:hypothetical protein
MKRKYYRDFIDKIKILLNPLLINKEKAARFFDPSQKLTIHHAGAFTALSIHAEWFNPYFDYQIQIAAAIYELVIKGVLDYPDIEYFTMYCIYKYPYTFMLNIVEIEFYSDFKKQNIKIKPDGFTQNIDKAKQLGLLYQFHLFNESTGRKEPTDTYYVPNARNISCFSIYNKLAKSIQDNHVSRKELEENQNPIRAEFRIDSANTDLLHWNNLKGNYFQIFKRYMNYLAVVYNTHIRGLVDFKCNENQSFQKVINTARKKNPQRYTEGKLKKSYEYSNEKLHPETAFSDIEIVFKKLKEYSKIDKIAKSKNGLNEAKNLQKQIENCQKQINNADI